MRFLAKIYDTNSTSYSLVQEQPQPLFDNDYILAKAIFEYVLLICQCHSFNFLEPYVYLIIFKNK